MCGKNGTKPAVGKTVSAEAANFLYFFLPQSRKPDGRLL
jgi:hypothetical protein